MDKAKEQILNFALNEGIISHTEYQEIEVLCDQGLVERVAIDYCTPKGTSLNVFLHNVSYFLSLIHI